MESSQRFDDGVTQLGVDVAVQTQRRRAIAHRKHDPLLVESGQDRLGPVGAHPGVPAQVVRAERARTIEIGGGRGPNVFVIGFQRFQPTHGLFVAPREAVRHRLQDAATADRPQRRLGADHERLAAHRHDGRGAIELRHTRLARLQDLPVQQRNAGHDLRGAEIQPYPPAMFQRPRARGHQVQSHCEQR